MERVDRRQPIEDMRVELKAAWPDPVKAARRLAAHGNAARGDSLLWLIGVDEAHGVTGASFEELSSWHAKLKREFDELSPDMTPLNVSTPRGTVVALLFETSRAPFVVKNPEGGAVQFEVPWRDGNSTHSAHRSELLRLLLPTLTVPALELYDAELSMGDRKSVLVMASPDDGR